MIVHKTISAQDDVRLIGMFLKMCEIYLVVSDRFKKNLLPDPPGNNVRIAAGTVESSVSGHDLNRQGVRSVYRNSKIKSIIK